MATAASAVNPLSLEQVWYDKYRAEDAETAYHEQLVGCGGKTSAAAPQQQAGSVQGPVDSAVLSKIESLEKENQELRQVTQNLAGVLKELGERIMALEKAGATNNHNKAGSPPSAAPAKTDAPKQAESKDDEEDDFDLFGSSDEEEVDEEAEKLKEERLAAYAAKKSKKVAVIAKSSLLLDVKPWDDETDMVQLEKHVRSIEMDGLIWGAGKLVPVGYGIKKLVINCVVEDDKVSTDDLEEHIVGFEEYIQSMDIAAFNKI